ncbi:hypothetical protein [Cohnella sp. WQ 127256]|nr:hypothetical protein [Cohnella sp. WQ 127256]
MTDLELKEHGVISLLDSNFSRGLYILPKNKNKIEEVTTKALNRSIEIYYRDELIEQLPTITHVIKGINLVFTMDEETLGRLDQIIKDNK